MRAGKTLWAELACKWRWWRALARRRSAYLAPSNAATDSLDLRRALRSAVCGGGDFAAHGRVSDFGARHRGYALQSCGGTPRGSAGGILAGGFRAAPAANRAGDFGGSIAFDGGGRFSSAAAKSVGGPVRVGSFERRGAGSDR